MVLTGQQEPTQKHALFGELMPNNGYIHKSTEY